MEKATLMVFILDQLPGFSDVLNLTFDVLTRANPDILVSHPQYCDPTLAEPILGVVNQQFIKLDPGYKNIITPINQEVDLSAYDETLDAINYAKNLKEMEISKSIKANQQALLELANISFKEKYRHTTDFPIKNTTAFLTKVPVRLQNVEEKTTVLEDVAPYLVAIFETVSNVTAQTCGGVLMSPNWVLTSADCLNLLRDFNIPGIKPNDTSIYSTVIGAKNPLEDGKAYNVTDIFVYPNVNKIDDRHVQDQCKKEYRNKVALMKIRRRTFNDAPAQKLKRLQVVSDEVERENVTVLGWSMLNGSTSNDIHPSYIPGTIFKCNSNSSSSDLCLDINGDIAKQISAGGPVLVRRQAEPALLALLTVAEDRPYTVAALGPCASWIHDVVNS